MCIASKLKQKVIFKRKQKTIDPLKLSSLFRMNVKYIY